MDRVLTRNRSARTTDVERVAGAPLMSLRDRPSVDGSRNYVGDSQVVTVLIPTKDIPTAVSVLLNHVPTDATPRSGVKCSGAHTGATIEEYHDATHVWSRTQVWFIANVDGVSQKWLII